jgi:N-acetylmuramoyl-L-alanine amidase
LGIYGIAESYKKILIFILFILFFVLPAVSPALEKSEVTDVRYWSSPNYTRVVVDLSNNIEYTKNRLSNPDRLYFDLKNSSIKNEVRKNLAVGNDMLKSVRASQFNKDTVRVVLDLDKIREYKVITLEDPIKLIIDVYGQKQPSLSVNKRIVIDAGHGGHDPGAVGPKKLHEKDVVLDIALKLREIISANKKYEVFLTRDKDVFIPLEKRTAIANLKNADLFISIHANASPKQQANGIETYLLNWTNDEESMKVAARENAISLSKMKKMKQGMDIIDIIKSDLSRENKRDESIKLANYVQRSMVKGLGKDHNNTKDLGVKQALFYVLFGAQMPSVLVEVSFISNPIEEKLLAKEHYRKDIAKHIASGIDKYMSLAPDMNTIADTRK